MLFSRGDYNSDEFFSKNQCGVESGGMPKILIISKFSQTVKKKFSCI